MVGFGTLINFVAILAGGIAGLFLGNRFSQRMQDTVNKACGISVLFIGIAGAMEGMLSLENGSLNSGQSLLITLCLVLGALVGELINIEGWFERLGEWLKIKSGNAGDNRFLDGFLTASLTVCIGAMAIVGAIEDGMYGDFSILARSDSGDDHGLLPGRRLCVLRHSGGRAGGRHYGPGPPDQAGDDAGGAV